MVADLTIDRPTVLERNSDYWVGRFESMASPCEVLMRVDDELLAKKLLHAATTEAWRIEQKYSRYREDNIVFQINSAGGEAVQVDPETAQILDFAFQCHELSGGLFDISSGILGRAWRFNSTSTRPSNDLIESLLPLIGLGKAEWLSSSLMLTLPAQMQIDLGGIGKEYAVDRTLSLLSKLSQAPVLVNFGGDIVCSNNPDSDSPWRIGIEDPESPNDAQQLLELSSGALATSGNTQRYLIANGRRYGHVLNPSTGWPIEAAPLSITVAEENCTRAGMLATFAMLQGENAEHFLDQQGVKYWVVR
ncbi:MAG: FAD:protein FMN transferase [Gammaproteobacteria bacterium]|nr:FAD:protein FMN transferase [Gammaproteobacteria bacterium]